MKNLNTIFENVSFENSNSQLYQKAWLYVTENEKLSPLEKKIINPYVELTNALDALAVQESCLVRSQLKCRTLASLLIDDQGDLDQDLLLKVIEIFKKKLYSIGPGQEADSTSMEHLLRGLTQISEDPQISDFIKNITKPFSHQYADDLIRVSLALSKDVNVSDVQTKRAVLSAWLCLLRQNLGSCFATAPAILIQIEQPQQLLEDIEELLSTGRLSRIIDGNVYEVPLSLSWGNGGLKKPFLYHPQLFPIWKSYGLMFALKAAHIFSSETSLCECEATLKALLDQTSLFSEQRSRMITMDYLIRLVLMQKNQITEQDLEAMQTQEKKFVLPGTLVINPKNSTNLKNQELSLKAFNEQYTMAKNAFKRMTDHPLLKAWEFSLASFSESKTNVYRWNLYLSLGFDKNEKWGIGNCIFNYLDMKVKELNQIIKENQLKYEDAFYRAKSLEAGLKGIGDGGSGWEKIEYRNVAHEMNTFLEIRNKSFEKGKVLSNLFDFILSQLDSKFPDYFQEIYDPEMQDVNPGLYDDSPAGFRLLYKHGRSNTSQWNLIDNAEGFIHYLSDFFRAVEVDLRSRSELESVQKEIIDIITEIITLIKTDEFLVTSFNRISRAREKTTQTDPLNNLEKVKFKPWAYISGGTMGNLVSCYFRYPGLLTEQGKNIESETELLVFLLDLIKELPPLISQNFKTNPEKSLLMSSPTHAFLLKPGLSSFRRGWESKEYTYTWVRDSVIIPARNFLHNVLLDEEIMSNFINFLASKFPPYFGHLIKKSFQSRWRDMNLKVFRDYIIQILLNDTTQFQMHKIFSEEQIDSYIYEFFPACKGGLLKEKIQQILLLLPQYQEADVNNMMKIFDGLPLPSLRFHVFCSIRVFELIKTLILLYESKSTSQFDISRLVYEAMQKEGLAMPKPILFADTNWPKSYFAFVVNPGTDNLELWRTDEQGMNGIQMKSWKKWLDGSTQKEWGVFTDPNQYSG